MSKKRLLEILDDIFKGALKPRIILTLHNGATVSGPDYLKLIRTLKVIQKVDRRHE